MTISRDALVRLTTFVPDHALAAVLEQPDREFAPLERREGAVLRLELSNLHALVEALSLRGRAGADELAKQPDSMDALRSMVK